MNQTGFWDCLLIFDGVDTTWLSTVWNYGAPGTARQRLRICKCLGNAGLLASRVLSIDPGGINCREHFGGFRQRATR